MPKRAQAEASGAATIVNARHTIQRIHCPREIISTTASALLEKQFPDRWSIREPSQAELARGERMAHLNITLEHGLTLKDAEEQFRAAIDDLRSRYSGWIGVVQIADDGKSAVVTGTGYEIRARIDDRNLYVDGKVPLAWKFLEGLIRNQIKAHIDGVSPKHLTAR